MQKTFSAGWKLLIKKNRLESSLELGKEVKIVSNVYSMNRLVES